MTYDPTPHVPAPRSPAPLQTDALCRAAAICLARGGRLEEMTTTSNPMRPLEFIASQMLDATAPIGLRMRAAEVLLPYTEQAVRSKEISVQTSDGRTDTTFRILLEEPITPPPDSPAAYGGGSGAVHSPAKK